MSRARATSSAIGKEFSVPLHSLWFAMALMLSAQTARSASTASPPCCIQVVDQENGWPVPLVELRTTHDARFITDNAGVIAFDLPELMGRETWFDVLGNGYEVPRDGFGMSGVRLTPQPGKIGRAHV